MYAVTVAHALLVIAGIVLAAVGYVFLRRRPAPDAPVASPEREHTSTH